MEKKKGKIKYDQKRYGFLVRFAYVLFIVCEEITKLALSFLQRDMLPKHYSLKHSYLCLYVNEFKGSLLISG